ncbi:hypothetical protein BVRB_2g026610 [Beta vulgaris subsp. vulgaris]|nr:hypothetical protein BVRB_2g026610 [Beta vulgaris subsp. vulgaris]
MRSPSDWITLNTNVAAKGNLGMAGGGGVIRDSRGGFIKAIAANFGVCNAYKAKILATEMELAMAVSLGIQKLVLQMDNQACLASMRSVEYHGGKFIT